MKNFFKILIISFFILSVQLTAYSQISEYDSVVLRQKGLEAYKAKNYNKSIEYLTAIPKSEHTLEIVICLANSYESTGNVRAAVLLLESLNRNNLNNYTAFYNLGNIYLKAKVYKNAIDSYKTCNRLNSRFAPAYYNLGIAYFEVKDYNKALFNFEKAIRLNPSNKDYIYNAAVCLEVLGDAKGAAEYFEKAK